MTYRYQSTQKHIYILNKHVNTIKTCNRRIINAASPMSKHRSLNELKEEEYIINDIDISKDSNWLLCITNKDKSLKIFDIISTNLIEWVQFDKTPLSMNLSPNSLYIAMSFEVEKGIYLYINRTLFVDLEDIENVEEPVHCTLAAFKAKMLKQRDEHELNDVNEDNFIKESIEKESDDREKFVEIPEENENTVSI